MIDYLLDINRSLGKDIDHGKSSLVSFSFMFDITYVRYCSDFNPLALTVWTIENNLPVVIAPPAVLQYKIHNNYHKWCI